MQGVPDEDRRVGDGPVSAGTAGTGTASTGTAETIRVLVLLWLSGASLRATILALPPVLPQISRDLGLGASDIGLLTALPSLLFALASLPGALLIGRLGAVAALALGLLVNALGTFLRGFSVDALTLDAATFVMCLGVAVMQPALPPLVRAWAPTRIGFATAFYTNGLLVGEVMPAAWIPQPPLPLVGDGWRATLAIWSVLALATAGLVTLFGARPKRDPKAAPRWWPDWRSGRIWRLGLLLGGINATYFGLNGFIPAWLTANGGSDLVQPALLTLNAAQLPASLLMIVFAERLVRRPGVYGITGATMLAGILGVLALPGTAAVASAGVAGFATAVLLTLALALPSLVGPAEDVPRLSAAMFTVSYALAMALALAGGWLWNLTGLPALAFLPVVAAALLTTVLGASLRLGDPADA